MIALKRVKTLPETMLEVERDECSSGWPSLRRRFAAVPLESPRSIAASLIAAYSIGCASDGVEARTQPRLLGHRPRWRGRPRGRAGSGERRLRVRLGGRVLRLRRGQRAGLAGAADDDDQA